MTRITRDSFKQLVRAIALVSPALLMWVVSVNAASTEDEDRRRCLQPSKDKPCMTDGGYAGSFGVNDPVTGAPIRGCYSVNFTRVRDAGPDNSGSPQCPTDDAPIFIDVHVSKGCGDAKKMYTAKQCDTGSYLRVQPIYIVQGESGSTDKFKYGYIKLPNFNPWILSATTVLDRYREICDSLGGDGYVWDDSTRTCIKDPQLVCETDLGLTWQDGKCQPPSPICDDSKCGEKELYCDGYLFQPTGEWCFCSGNKRTEKCLLADMVPARPPQRQLTIKCPTCPRGGQNPLWTFETRNGSPKRCGCTCPGSQNCAQNFNYDLNTCSCVCSLSQAACDAQGKDFDSANPGACRCIDKPGCSLTNASCTAQGKVLDWGNCACVPNTCALTPASCTDPLMPYLDEAACACSGCRPPPDPSKNWGIGVGFESWDRGSSGSGPGCTRPEEWVPGGIACVWFSGNAKTAAPIKHCGGARCVDLGPGLGAGNFNAQCGDFCDESGGNPNWTACPRVCP